MSEHLEPARTVIAKLGGLDEAAEAAGVSKSRVCRWRLPKERGGTGGLIPAQHHQPILDWARANGLGVRPSDFFSKLVSSPLTVNVGADRVA